MKNGFAAAVLLLASIECHASSGAFEDLLRNSPFAGPAHRDGANDSQPLEFRGFVFEDSAPMFSIYDPGTRHSYWLRQNETADGVTITGFDEAAGTISLVDNGRPLDLVLKRAQVMPFHSPSPGVSPSAAAQWGIDPTTETEAQREADALKLKQMREELLHRRALLLARHPSLINGPPAER